MTRLVADVGNTRLKWGRLASDGSLTDTRALPVDEPGAWTRALVDWDLTGTPGTTWAIASVNPVVSDRLVELLTRSAGATVRLYRSAADVPLAHALTTPATTGADRALAVLAALARHGGRGPGQVVSCGTAITVERISLDGCWNGGAIAPGLGPSALALNRATAQLPLVLPGVDAPRPWGDSTEPALVAGLFWGAVGAVRELLARQAMHFDAPPWLVWTGGDAPALARHVAGETVRIVPDLVLEGLALAAFPTD